MRDAKGAQWPKFCALADITLATSAAASQVPISFILQDQVFLLVWAFKDIREYQVAMLRRLPGLDNMVHCTWRWAKDELIVHVTENMTRWAGVQAVIVRTVPLAPFKKKLKAATWGGGRGDPQR